MGHDTGGNRNYVQMIGSSPGVTPGGVRSRSRASDPETEEFPQMPILLVQKTLLMKSSLGSYSRRLFACAACSALLSRKSLSARWQPPPRLRRRGDGLHRSRHVKTRLPMCGTPRRARALSPWWGRANASPACCERAKPGPPVHMRARRRIAVVKASPHPRVNRSINSGGRWA